MNKWRKSLLAGSYVSQCGKFSAELRPAGFYSEFGCRLTRHYLVRLTGSRSVLGTAKTLEDATKYIG